MLYPPKAMSCVTFLGLFILIDSLHLTGTFSNKDFFLFLSKFGFQKVDRTEKTGSQGYIYGNITSPSELNYDMYLVVVDSEYFLQYYKLKDTSNSPEKCTNMFHDIDTTSWDRFCAPNGREDFLRRIPCPQNGYCTEELFDTSAVISQSQFTYHIIDTNQPRFWYVSLVACHRPRGPSCKWSFNSSVDLDVSYDIWFVNGDPASKHLNPFEHQFSYEMHDVVEIYLAFLVLNILLLVIQVLVFKRQVHLLIRLVTAVISMEVAGMLFNLLHFLIFAFDGKGVPVLSIFGNFIDMCAQCTVMLEILYIGKGWTITRQTLTKKILLYSIWIIYSTIYIILFIFNVISVDLIEDKDEWQTVPGYCILVFRIIIMVYFVYELQNTVSREDNSAKRSFYTRIGASFLVWFIYLPIIALISPKIAALWRFKTLLSIQCGADFALMVLLIHIFWPSDTMRYFDIPRNDNSPTIEQMRLVTSEDSSEDELYERQAKMHMKSVNYSNYGNGSVNNNHRQPEKSPNPSQVEAAQDESSC